MGGNVEISIRVAGRGPGNFRRGLDAGNTEPPLQKRAGKGRRRESYGEFQSARTGAGRNDGQAVRIEEIGGAICGKRRGRSGSVRGGGWNRSEHFYAQGCAV